MITLTEPTSNDTNTVRIDNEILINFDPFFTDQNPIRVNSTDVTALETTLEIALLGVRQNIGDAAHGSAIIRLPNKKERVFTIGDEIVNDAKLRAVFANYIEINHRGSIETLYLLGTTTRETATKATNLKPIEQNTVARTISGNDLITFVKTTKLEPRRNGRQITGWVVIQNDTPRALTLLGLEQGDIITGINDVKLRRAETFTELVEEIGNVTRLVIRLERDSKPIELTFGYKAR